MAYSQVVEFGMSPSIGHISLPRNRPSEPARRMYSDKLARMIDEVHIHDMYMYMYMYTATCMYMYMYNIGVTYMYVLWIPISYGA